jgi:class 3 adenylate cyclase/tetratricopeptide (TPR) repeat protein
VLCAACGDENKAGRKFCASCGSPLARGCPACGAANEPDDRFCGECGALLEPGEAAPPPPPAAARTPTAERRLVSVLFADLVGFTTLSEARDAEEVRELLSRYFETARQVIGRYGGTVEKFIGDAVMAVWGTPVAQEDDAERSVRAALELVEAIRALGEELEAPDLRLRAGVVTGEAAVTIGAEGQGMVAGDLVNTASRVQSVARPGTVLVGEATRRASQAAIAYEDAGSHELKGKAEPVPLWRAERVIAGRGGTGRSARIEAPFVGREGELRLLKDLYHATADESRARLVSVAGVAGIGKSRLGWEFYKYIDGLLENVWWHRGRSLAYGEGVAYWALAEMIRMRAGISENEATEAARAKLAKVTAQFVPDPEERAWVEPQLAHLLGLEEGGAADREDLFSAWRLFFERMAEQGPAVLLFEDLQWADNGLLDFIEYLLEWSRSSPLYVVTLARPELLERRPSWGAARRNFTSLYLEPLGADAMDQLLSGLVPGLPDELRARVRDRAEGIPLYAVETVRMLLDRGLLVHEEDRYRPTGAVETLGIPETLHALIAARLDGLPVEERRLLEDASVLGKTFTKQALVALSGLPDSELDGLLTSLVRKEILTLQADPRSPERGQYGFLQALVQKIAHDTLSKRERKARHLAAARYLEASWGEDEEIVEVVASHYRDAYEAAPEAPDAPEIKAKASSVLARAGERAASLGATDEAQRYFEQAAALADATPEQARLFERAGHTALVGARWPEAERHFRHAMALFESEGDTQAWGRVAPALGKLLAERGESEEGLHLMERALELLSRHEAGPALANAASTLGSLELFMGRRARAMERIELALEIAESLRLPDVFTRAISRRSIALSFFGRDQEGEALQQLALAVALENDLPRDAFLAYLNLAHFALQRDDHEQALAHTQSGLALARKRGDRNGEWEMLGQSMHPLYLRGEWDAAMAALAEIPEEARSQPQYSLFLLLPTARIYAARGALDGAEALLAPLAGSEASLDIQIRVTFAVAQAIVLNARGRSDEALAACERVWADRGTGVARLYLDEALVEAVEAAFALGERERAEALLREVEGLHPGERSQHLNAHDDRFRARLAAGDAEERFRGAVNLFRELGTPFWLAVTLLEHGEWLAAEGRQDEAGPLLAEATGVFEHLGAVPWLERARRIVAPPEASMEASEPVATRA